MPDQEALRQTLDGISASMVTALERQIKAGRQHLKVLADSPALQSPNAYLQQRQKNVEMLKNRLISAQNQNLSRKKQHYVALASKLDAMSPLKVLTRGYAMAQTGDGIILRSTRQVSVGNNISVSLSDGTLFAQVTDKKERLG